MPKRKKRSRPAKPAPSPETSKAPFEVKLDPDLLEELRALPKNERKEIGELIENVRAGFGHPHLHRGTGIRALGRGLYECRYGLHLRLVFSAYRALLYFHMMGTHDEVQRFLNAHR